MLWDLATCATASRRLAEIFEENVREGCMNGAGYSKIPLLEFLLCFFSSGVQQHSQLCSLCIKASIFQSGTTNDSSIMIKGQSVLMVSPT